MGVNLGGEQEVMINVSLPDETRADSADGFDLDSLKTDANYQLRYILEIYRDGAEDGKKYRDVKYSDDTSVSFPVRLAPGRAYSIAVWADVVSQTNPGDLYYNAESLKNISINESYWTAMDEKRDAFYGKASLDTDDHVADMSTITLKRPFAKIRVISTDIDAVRNFDLDPTNVSVEYLSELYTSFDAVSGAAVGATTSNKVVTANYDTAKYADFNTNEATLFADYIFVPANGTIQFAMTVNAAAGVINTASFTTPIPVEVNKVTTIKGDVLTEGGNVSVKIENELGEKETINMVNTAESLQEIINNTQVGESANIALGGDIDLDDLLGAGILSTRAAANAGLVIPEGKSVVLDLNGFTISQSKACDASYSMITNNGNLTILGGGIVEFTNTAEGGGSTWGTYTIENRGEGVLTIDNATIRHNGCVNGEINHDTNIAIQNYQGKVVVNNGTIASTQFRSLRDFTAGGEIIINGGTFLGQVWMQGLGNGSSSLTITGGSFSPVEGYDGSSVYITNNTNVVNVAITGGMFNTKVGCFDANKEGAKGCITGGTFTTAAKENTAAALINDDYAWVEAENGLWTLDRKADVAKIGEVGYTSLAKAVAAAQNGDTILFVADVEQEDGVIITDKNITIDLNDKTFTVSNGASTNNRNFKVNGSSVVTIKNGTMVAEGDYSSGAYGTLRTEGTANVTLEDVILYNYRGNGLNVKALTGTTVTITDAEVYSQYGGGIESAGGTIELTNVKVEQKGMYTAPYNSMAISVNGGGTVTVNSGTYSTECITAEEANNQGTSHGPWCAGVLNSGGTLIIKGGTFSNDNFGENTLATHARGLLLADTGANIQIKGGAFNALKAIIDMTNNLGDASRNPSATISGGDFSADPQVSGLYASHLIKIAAGYEAVEENDRWIVRKPQALAAFEAAIAKGGNVTLAADITLVESVVIEGKKVVLDLNGKTVTAPLFSAFEVKTGAELTIKNGKVVAYESTVRAVGGKATIESGEYTSTGTALDSPATYRYSLDCREGGELIINGGTFKSNNGMINVGSTVTINGGKFENIVEKSMTRHFAYVSAPLTINDGEFYGKANSSAGGCFFCGAAAGGNIQVKGGKFTSLWTSGSVNRIFEVYFGGTINVTGGMFNTNGGIASFVKENTDEATKAAYPYVAK